MSLRIALAPLLFLLLLGAAPEPDPASEAALQAGQILEAAGRLEDAEKEYREALKATAPEVRRKALQSYRRLVRTRENLGEQLISSSIASFEWLLNWVFLPVLLLLLYGSVRLSRYMGWAGRNRLEVRNWSSTNDAWKGDHFREVVASMLHRMRPKPDMLLEMGTSSKPPILIRDLSIGSVAELIPGNAGKWLNWLAGTFQKPEYSIGGSLQVLDSVSHVIVCLDRFERPVEIWEDTCPVTDSRNRVKDFVYLALIAIKQGRGRSRAH